MTWQDIKRVGLIGAGAVGSYIIMNLQPRLGSDFVVFADGERKNRLSEQGIKINGQHYDLNVHDFESAEPVDILFVATKYNALPEVALKVNLLVGTNTVVLSMLNGINSEDILSASVGAKQVMPALIQIISAHSNNEIVMDASWKPVIYFGERDGEMSERGRAIEEFLQANNINAVLRENVISDQWNKYAINLANNLVQAVFGVGYGAYFDSPHVSYIHQRVISEIFVVAAAEGVIIDAIPTKRKVALPKARFSTLQDLDAKRPTEVDMFLLPFLELAASHNIQVPFSDYTYHALKALEEKNAGKFQY